MPFRTPVAILLLLISKVALAEGTFLLVQRLPLRRNHYFDPFRIDLLKLLCIRISCICRGCLAGLLQNLVGLIDLLGKLIDVTGLTNRFRMHDQPVLVIHHALHVIAGMRALNAVHDRTVRIGQIDLISPRLFHGL